MYQLLYRKLPGGKFAKFLQMTVLLAVVVATLFFVVFPFVDSILQQEPAVNG